MTNKRGRGGAATRGTGARAKPPARAKRSADDPEADFETPPAPKRKKAVPIPEPRQLPERATKPDHPGDPDAPRAKRTHLEKQADDAQRAAALEDRQRRREKALAEIAKLNAEQDAADAEERENTIYGLDDVPFGDMDVDDPQAAHNEDEAILNVTEEDFARAENDEAYLSAPEYSDKPKPAKGETRAAIDAATKVVVAGKSRGVNAGPAVKKKGVQNSDAAAASSKAGISKRWTQARSGSKTLPAEPDGLNTFDGGLSHADASAERPNFAAEPRVPRKNNEMVTIVVSSDEETPSRPAEGKRKSIAPHEHPIKNKPATRLPALSFVSKTPTIVKSESSSSSSFTPASSADVNGMPAFIAGTWGGIFLPACYRALYRSHEPMGLGVFGKNPKDTVAILQKVLDETYPGNTWVLQWGDSICSKVVSRIGERRSAIARFPTQLVDEKYKGPDFYKPLESPIPGSRVPDPDKIAADVRDALRANGPAFFKYPTPAHLSNLDPMDPTYIKPTGYLESSVIADTVKQFIKDEEFGVFVTETADGEVLDFSELPTGLLGMAAAATERAYKNHITGVRVTKVPEFSSANYGTAVAGFIMSIKKFRTSRWESIIESCGGGVMQLTADPVASDSVNLDGVRENMYIPSSPN
ncbi:hypothetical protein MVEN_02573900 [Mycena venus]|uniref:Uncharacterized protein n=1 Tax=Mycena venus TaxID=2733690 RepID=A0A8H6WUC7_9AGAR|nr:hypothetical protein MVEN_02573900 [Mycena venus]